MSPEPSPFALPASEAAPLKPEKDDGAADAGRTVDDHIRSREVAEGSSAFAGVPPFRMIQSGIARPRVPRIPTWSYVSRPVQGGVVRRPRRSGDRAFPQGN